MRTDDYYLSGLPKDEREIYLGIFRNLNGGKLSFQVPSVDLKMLSELYQKVRLDHPEIVGSETFSVRRCPGADHMDFAVTTRFDSGKLMEIRESVGVRLNKIAGGFRYDGYPAGRDRAAAEYAQSFILGNVRYDRMKKLYAHEISGPLCHGIGVCEGIAKTVQAILKRLDVRCITVIAPSVTEERLNHAWNIVWVGGRPLHLDATFDLSLTESTGKRTKRWFLIPDEKIYLDHGRPIYVVPVCGEK